MQVNPPYRVAFAPASGGPPETVEAAGLTLDQIESASARYPEGKRGELAEFRFLVPGQVAYLKVRGFGGGAVEGKTLPEYFDAKFNEIAGARAKSLVLDLRGNGGGIDQLARQLFSYLYDKPFRYYDALFLNKLEFDLNMYVPEARPVPASQVTKNANGRYDWTSHPNWGEMKPRDPHFAGKTCVLIDGGSFSATCEFAAKAHFHKVATFVGEETAGAYTGNTSGITANVVLPNTKCRIGVPLCAYYMAVKTDRPDRGIFPDVPVAPTLQDLLADRDPALERALALAKA